MILNAEFSVVTLQPFPRMYWMAFAACESCWEERAWAEGAFRRSRPAESPKQMPVLVMATFWSLEKVIGLSEESELEAALLADEYKIAWNGKAVIDRGLRELWCCSQVVRMVELQWFCDEMWFLLRVRRYEKAPLMRGLWALTRSWRSFIIWLRWCWLRRWRRILSLYQINLMLNDDYLPSVLRYSKVVVLCFSLIASLFGQGDRVGCRLWAKIFAGMLVLGWWIRLAIMLNKSNCSSSTNEDLL